MQAFRAYTALALLGGFLLVHGTQAGAEPTTADWSNAQTVQVGMANYDFTPKTLEFHVNKAYRLRLTNGAGHGHSFDAPEFFAAVSIAPEDQSKVVKGEVEVEGGQTVDVKFVPATTGSYKFHCSHFLHAAFGMTGEAVVQ
jgi:FtsP/CotA-like multicopper oxidase with cupredoxin domain